MNAKSADICYFVMYPDSCTKSTSVMKLHKASWSFVMNLNLVKSKSTTEIHYCREDHWGDTYENGVWTYELMKEIRFSIKIF